MSDPTQIPPEAADLAKLGTGGGLGAVVLFAIQKLWGSADKRDEKINAKLDSIVEGIGDVKSEVADVRADLKVLTNERLRDMEDVRSLKADVDKLQNELAEMRGAFKHHLAGQIVE